METLNQIKVKKSGQVLQQYEKTPTWHVPRQHMQLNHIFYMPFGWIETGKIFRQYRFRNLAYFLATRAYLSFLTKSGIFFGNATFI